MFVSLKTEVRQLNNAWIVQDVQDGIFPQNIHSFSWNIFEMFNTHL